MNIVSPHVIIINKKKSFKIHQLLNESKKLIFAYDSDRNCISKLLSVSK